MWLKMIHDFIPDFIVSLPFCRLLSVASVRVVDSLLVYPDRTDFCPQRDNCYILFAGVQ